MAKYILLGLYVLVLIFSGIVNRKNAKTSSGFFLGGRDVGPILSAFAFVTTYISAVALINAGKFGWDFGIGTLYNGLANVVLGILIAWLVLGRKTRDMTQRLDTMTMPDFLKVRYGSNYFKLLGAILIFVFMIPYSGGVFMGLSYLFESIFHIPYYYALVVMTVLVAIYLTLGGYKAVALADAIQGIIMIVGAIVMVAYLVNSPAVGGSVEGIRRLTRANPDLTSFAMGGWENWRILIPIILVTSLAPIGMPQMVQKFFAIDNNPKSIPYATIICSICGFVIIMGMHYVGFFAHLFFKKLPVDAQTLVPNADLIIPQMLEQFLPEFALALVFLLIVSASMSTLAGIVMVSSSSISLDLLKGYLRPEMSDKKVTAIMRVLCVIFVIFSLVIAVLKPTSVLTLMSVSWGAISGFFLAPYIYGVLWKGVTQAGAFIAGLVGFLIAVVLPLGFHVNSTVATAFALIIPLILTPIISWFTPKFSKKHIEYVFGEDGSHLNDSQLTSKIM